MSTSKVPTTQKAWRVVRRGKPSEALVLEDNLPLKTLGPREVLIRVEAAALNPVGYKLMGLLPNAVARRPHISEGDFTGIVVDSNSAEFKAGDAVMGLFNFPSLNAQRGALSTYAIAADTEIVHRPKSLSPEEAAGIPLVAMTALQGLVHIAKIEEGQSIFINGGTSSVGIAAIQIAKAYGCKVTTTCSTGSIDLVKSLGADEVIDYTVAPAHQQLLAKPPSPRFHAILDAIGSGPEIFKYSATYMDPSGIYMLAGSPVPHGIREWISAISMIVQIKVLPRWLGGTNRNSNTFLLHPTKEYLLSVAKLIEEGNLRPVVDSVHSFEETLKAYDRIMSGRAKGKVVVRVS